MSTLTVPRFSLHSVELKRRIRESFGMKQKRSATGRLVTPGIKSIAHGRYRLAIGLPENLKEQIARAAQERLSAMLTGSGIDSRVVKVGNVIIRVEFKFSGETWETRQAADPSLVEAAKPLRMPAKKAAPADLIEQLKKQINNGQSKVGAAHLNQAVAKLAAQFKQVEQPVSR
jgi:hypothetical protein